jgi:hypothetical protein
MKSLPSALAIAGLFCVISLAFATNNSARAPEPGSPKEYDSFHELLHPLEHDALPQKDFRRIRENAGELIKRGAAMVKLGVPNGTAEKNVTEFRKELRKFDSALKQFSNAAKKGTDAQVETTFSAVHDSFEMLMGLLP